MNKPKNLRVIDQTSFSAKNRSDFTIRKHGFSGRPLYSLIPVILIIAASVAFLVYYNMMLGAIICIVTGLLLNVFAKYSEHHKKALETTEFLNALFSSTLAAGYKFCIIVRQGDGQIVYLNNGFQKMFPEMLPAANRTLDLLFSHYKITESQRQTILQAAKKGVAKEVPVRIDAGKDKKKTSLAIVVEPIPRPGGFCLIRGR